MIAGLAFHITGGQADPAGFAGGRPTGDDEFLAIAEKQRPVIAAAKSQPADETVALERCGESAGRAVGGLDAEGG